MSFFKAAGLSKRSSNEAAGEKGPQAYPLGYVEDRFEPRTKLGTVFTSLLAQQCHDGQTHEQIVDRMGENAGQEASGLFVDPSPEHSAPTHTQ